MLTSCCQAESAQPAFGTNATRQSAAVLPVIQLIRILPPPLCLGRVGGMSAYLVMCMCCQSDIEIISEIISCNATSYVICITCVEPSGFPRTAGQTKKTAVCQEHVVTLGLA